MTLMFRDCVVAELETDGSGRPSSLRYDRRWLATRGAFPVSLSLRLCDAAYEGVRVAQWGRGLTRDGETPFSERLDEGRNVALFGALNLVRRETSEPREPSAERMITESEVGECGLEEIAFMRTLADLCGLETTPWREMRTHTERAISVRRSDFTTDLDVRLPVEVVAFGAAPLRSATQFRKLEGALDAKARLQLFDRLAFSSHFGALAPATALRLDGAARLALAGADWVGRRRSSVGGRNEPSLSWTAFAVIAGLNATFAPRRAAMMAAEMRKNAFEAATVASAEAPRLSPTALQDCAHQLSERLSTQQFRAA